jgi:hypothetical protein
MLQLLRKIIAILYWLFVCSVFIRGVDGLVTVFLTLPWSILVLGIVALLDSIPLFAPFFKWLTTDTANFLMVPFLCGGLNAALIFGLSSLKYWSRK